MFKRNEALDFVLLFLFQHVQNNEVKCLCVNEFQQLFLKILTIKSINNILKIISKIKFCSEFERCPAFVSCAFYFAY